MNNFTAGPWKYSGRKGGNADFFIHNNDAILICITEKKADAQLIASAPDLLEALENIVNGHAVGDKIDWPEVLAAIAKARGYV